MKRFTVWRTAEGACKIAATARASSVPSLDPSPGPHRTVPARAARPLAELRTGLHWDALPDRDLDRTELLDLVASVAERPELWQQRLVQHDERQRQFACLHRDAYVDVWILGWTTEGDTGWHDHDVSSGAVAVTRGALVEHNLALGTHPVTTEIEAGQGYAFGPDHIHRLTGRDAAGDVNAVSVHAYSPPLDRLGQYDIDADGVLRRTAIAYTDELRANDG